MNRLTEDELQKMMEASICYIHSEEIPNIDLYMDQVTTFMDRHLDGCKREEDDKLLTKTMINNYAKSRLLPPPEKKKYTREHMILLLTIYYLKNIMSINDIQTLVAPLTQNYFNGSSAPDLCMISDRIMEQSEKLFPDLKDDIMDKWRRACDLFSSEEDPDEFLSRYALIMLLSYDVCIRQRMIEQIIDEMTAGRKDDLLAAKEAEKEAKQAAKAAKKNASKE